MEFKFWLENSQKYQSFLKTKQSQYDRYFPRGTDDNNIFSSEHIRLRSAEGKQKTNEQKKTYKKKTIIVGEERPYHTSKGN